MPRLFVGLELPDMIKQQLLLAQGGVANARWQTPEQMHLTVRFIGEVDPMTARDIAEGLSSIEPVPAAFRLSGCGVFGKPGRPRMLWAGATPDADLVALHNKVDYRLVQMGLPAETRRYKPHVTIARFPARGRIDRLDHFMARSGGFTSPMMHIRHFCLYRSDLTRGGSVYSVMRRYGEDPDWLSTHDMGHDDDAFDYEADINNGRHVPAFA